MCKLLWKSKIAKTKDNTHITFMCICLVVTNNSLEFTGERSRRKRGPVGTG
jgi:hypothetical protein